jgi:GalNAc-alpha-(1->4)-GalNAc-alpha-(1->3)-diNAcBac-PP-undecaprenol alpha-1,4-N-acetyl-D-galactosaminyltransferase
MKKIALLIPSLDAGGMERVMTELANYLVAQPYVEVHLVLYGINRRIFYQLSENIKVYQPNFKFESRWRTWYTVRTMLFLRGNMFKLNPDCILSFGEYWNNLVLLALFQLPFPIILGDRSSPEKRLTCFQNMLRKFLYPKASAVIVQTDMARRIYERMIPKTSIVTIGNPIRSIAIDPGTPRENVVLSIGRLIESKHHDILIKIFHSVGMPGWKLIIVGEDAQRQSNQSRLKQLIKHLNAEESIFLVGKQHDVDSFYRRASVFAFTSSSEGFPNVLGEALSAGLPVISFNCVAGPSDLIQDGENGFLVPLFDKKSFIEKLKLLMQDQALRDYMSSNAIESVKKFNVDIIGATYYNLLMKSINS